MFPAQAVCALPVRNLQPQMPAVIGTAWWLAIRCGCAMGCCTSRTHTIEIPVACAAARTFFRSRTSPPVTIRSTYSSHFTARADIWRDRHARALCHRPAHLQEAATPACDAVVPHGPEGMSANFFGRLTISRLSFTCSLLSPVTLFLEPNGVCGVSAPLRLQCKRAIPTSPLSHGYTAWRLATRSESHFCTAAIGVTNNAFPFLMPSHHPGRFLHPSTSYPHPHASLLAAAPLKSDLPGLGQRLVVASQ